MSKFERENRYLVIKLSDLLAAESNGHIDEEDMDFLMDELPIIIDRQRKRRGKKPLECVVVESDWPMYEDTWKVIEKWVDDKDAEERKAFEEYSVGLFGRGALERYDGRYVSDLMEFSWQAWQAARQTEKK